MPKFIGLALVSVAATLATSECRFNRHGSRNGGREAKDRLRVNLGYKAQGQWGLAG